MSAMISPEGRAAIEDLLAAIAHATDDDALESWPDFFTEDGTYRIIPRADHEAGLPVGILSCQGRGMMRDRVLALRTANIYEAHSYCHVLGRTVLARAADGTIAARTNFALYRTQQAGPTTLFAAGKYLDRIAEFPAGPLLAAREVVLESRRIDILIVFPI
ncbi:MAG: aromatic-ring-hydroxylating dioxygenase subunit beta [Rhodospirillales bacterium]|nr:aromatic-ring-hydroxylating dioxygenase subunit beta [Rhodospirillales bacterium]